MTDFEKAEAEHQENLKNQLAEYEKQICARATEFVMERNRLSGEIADKQKELKDTREALDASSIKKTELDVAIESLNKEIKAKYETNALLSSESDEMSTKYSERRAWMEQNLDSLSRKFESVVTEIELANATLKQLEDEIVAKKEEVNTKGSEAACYLASLSSVVKEAEAKKDALLAEVDDLLSRRAPIVASIQSATTDLDAINARIEAAKVDMATADADLNKQRAAYTENITKFKDLDALRADISEKNDDLKFREEQLVKRAKTLNEQEARIKQMKG